MLEFYQAYSDYRDLMALTEELFAELAQKICGTTQITFGEQRVDFGRWQRLSMREAITQHWPGDAGPAPSAAELASPGGPRAIAARYNQWLQNEAVRSSAAPSGPLLDVSSMSDGEATGLLFEAVAASKLIKPTLLYDCPTH